MILTRSWNDTPLATLETLFHNANGYLGVRNSPEEGTVPGSIRGTYINAFYEDIPIRYGEKLYGFPDTKQTIVNLPDAQTVRLTAEDIRFSMFAPEVSERSQSLDTEAGITVRSMLWHHPRGDLFLRITRLASFLMPNVFVIRYELRSAGFTGKLVLSSSLCGEVTNYAADNDPRVAAEPLRCLRTLRRGTENGHAVWISRTSRSELTVACGVTHSCLWTGCWEEKENELTERFEGVLRPGETVTLEKRAVYTDSLRHEDCEKSERELMSELSSRGTDALFAGQADFLRDRRRNCFPVLTAPSPIPEAMDYDLFQLLQSTGRDGVGNVAAKGLSGEGYEGHTFWDSEMYVFPWFLWTQPETAKSMLVYRCRMLDNARRNAAALGLKKGALYPWRTISGTECSAFFPAGSAQYHITGDIAYAFWQYWLVTGDEAFMAEQGAAVLVETARAWTELGHMENDVFRIDCVTGPDEYTCLVNNNYYTNAVAQNNLLAAAAIWRVLREHGKTAAAEKATGVTEEEIRLFERCGQAMYFPRDKKLGISAQDDSFLQKKVLDLKSVPRESFPLLLHYHPLFLYRHQVCKQADTVLAHLLFPETADPETIRRSYEYYMKVTTHDSSLSMCIYGAMAARLGLPDEAEASFRNTVTLDLMDTHGNTGDGLHTASLGGAFLALLKGFAGLRAEGDRLSADPKLPGGWQGFDLPLIFRGQPLLLRIRNGEEWQLIPRETE